MFASVYIGTSEISMKLFELSRSRKLRIIDYLRRRFDLGKETLRNGAIPALAMDELCQCLMEYRRIMEGYGVDNYSAYAGPFLESAINADFVLEQVRIRTGLVATILSNTEQRFISYKSAACRDDFDERVEQGAAVVDIGGDSIQITLFSGGEVVTTQHLILGTLRIRERLHDVLGTSQRGYRQQIVELVDKEMEVFKELYLKGSSLNYMILIGDYCTEIMKKVSKKKDAPEVDTKEFLKLANKLSDRNLAEVAKELMLTNESDPRLLPTLLLTKRIAEVLKPEAVWVPGSNISDGIAYDFAQKKKIFPIRHDFDRDVRSAAIHMAKRYESYSSHVAAQVEICDIIFDAMKKVHGMGKRERLLLETAAILHDCGKYISSVDAAMCSYNVIMYSEIMGISAQERSVVAASVKYNVHPLPPFEETEERMDFETYMMVAKLSAILRLSNALDRSHRQKIRELKARRNGRELILTVRTEDNIQLEKNVLSAKAEAFERVYGYLPVLKERRL
ncbi:MAG: phosphatase [Lachnospiraceae bacterium]|nr:phosphatase [Lachnospiraceae bacterium]